MEGALDLRRVGFDLSPSRKREGSFFVEDHSISLLERLGEVEVMSLGEAQERYPELVERLRFSLIRPEGELAKFKEVTPTGYFIRVPAGVKMSFPVQSCYVVKTEGFEQRVHNLIIVEDGASAQIITGCTRGSHVLAGLHIGVTEIFVGKNASLTYTMVHEWGKEMEITPKTAVRVEEGGKYISNYFAVTEVKRVIAYPRAFLSRRAFAGFYSSIYAKGLSFFDTGAALILEGEGARGEIVSRVVAGDGSKVISRGLIEARSGATKGHMECNAIMISDYSCVQAIPELTSYHPDVELSHEAAVGKIAQEEIEYLMSRGISEEAAKSLIVKGFLTPRLENLTPELEEAVLNTIEEALRTAGSGM